MSEGQAERSFSRFDAPRFKRGFLRATPGLLRRPGEGRLWIAVGMVLAVQFCVLTAIAVHVYDRFGLTRPFGIFDQAWYQIAHGRLSPEATAYGYPFWRDHSALIMWPLSLLYWLSPNDGLTLLTIQNLALVAGEFVGLLWIGALARERRLSGAMTATCVAAGLAFFALDPWVYRGAAENFHFVTLASFFALAACYALWAGRARVMWIWVILALSTGDVAGVYLLGAGLGFALTTPRCRRPALAVAGVGAAWVGVVAALGANKGSALATFAYLAGSTAGSTPSIGAVAAGALAHPSRPLHMLEAHWHFDVKILIPTGVLGLFNPWTFGVIAVVLVTNSLSADGTFAGPGFQSTPIYLFGVTGTVMTAILLMNSRSVRPVVIGGALTGALVLCALFCLHELQSRVLPPVLDAATAHRLKTIRDDTPSGVEVLSTDNVIGRFSGRPYAYDVTWTKTVAINAKVVLIVLVPSPGMPTPADVRRVASAGRFPMTVLADGPHLWAYRWYPRPGTGTVTLNHR